MKREISGVTISACQPATMLVVSLGLLLTACSPDPMKQDAATTEAPAAATPAAPVPVVTAPNQPVAAQARVILGNDGITLAGSGGAPVAIGFGITKAAAITAMAGLGTAELGSNDECDSGPLEYGDWPNGLRLVFEHGMFAGWGINARDNPDASMKTDRGISTGSTRAALMAAYPETNVANSSFGVEFATPEIAGLLDSEAATARITNLSAGAECTFG